MSSVAEIVTALGGIAQKRQLVRRGARDRDLTLAVRDGSVIRARQGWYATLASDHPRVRAVRVGGRLAGLSAIAAAGGWVLDSRQLHVAVPHNASRLRSQHNRFRRFRVTSPAGVTLHWENVDSLARGDATSVSILDALTTVVRTESLETAVAAIDWARRTSAVAPDDLQLLSRRLPRRLRYVCDWSRERCDSLPESLARTRLMLEGHRVDVQYRISGIGPIDLVIDGRVALEVDGEQFHLHRFSADRDKDLHITTAGFHAIRPTARMVFYEWPRVLRAIRVALRADAPRSLGLRFG